MSSSPLPLEQVIDLAAQGATGELVSVCDGAEFHVYLQRGRIAWATDTRTRFAFGQYLIDHAALTRDELDEMLESCRRDRLSFGATLLEWGVVTLTVLREALRHQIVSATSALAEPGTYQSLFLPRAIYVEYDTRLTFSAGDIIRPDWHAHALSSRPPAPDVAWPDRLLARDRAAIPGATSVQLLEAQTVIGQDPPRFEAIVHSAVLRYTLLDGAHLAMVRGRMPTALGASLSGTRRTLWCQLEEGSPVGSSASALTQLALLTGRSPSRPRAVRGAPRETPRPSVTHETDRVDVAELLALVDRTPDVEGLVVMEDDRIVACVCRPGAAPGWLPALVQRRAPALARLMTEAPSNDDDDDLTTPSLVTCEGEGETERWCFGARLASGPTRTLWLVTECHTSHETGWDYMKTLSRRLTLPTLLTLFTHAPSAAAAAE